MKITKAKKWTIECPVCGEDVVTDSPAFFSDNVLFHTHKGEEKPVVVRLDEYRLKWKEAK